MRSKCLYAAACAAIACAVSSPAAANDADGKPTQQGRFASCAHESKGLKGDEHQRFMSECLRSHGGEDHAAAPRKASEPGQQQNRMKSCNEEARAKDLHGDERRSFMSNCLKG